jgi:hypothetical protein
VKDLRARALSGSWLASRLGIEPLRLDAMRRAGELVGIRVPGSTEYLYPAWQIGTDGKPHPAVARLVAEARAAGLDDERLDAILNARLGLGGRRRLSDELRDGRDEHVLAAIRNAG